MEDKPLDIQYSEPQPMDKAAPNYWRELEGIFKSSSSVPTEKPSRVGDGFILYTNGANNFLYIYDFEQDVWRKFDYVNIQAGDGISVSQTGNDVTISALQDNTLFGDGSDSDNTIVADTDLSRDWHYTNLVINATKNLNTKSYRLFVNGTLTVNGTIRNNGGVGGNGGNGGNGSLATGGTAGTAGSAGTAVASGSLPGGIAGTAGIAGVAGNGSSTQNLDGNIGNSGASASAITKPIVTTSPNAGKNGGAGGGVTYNSGTNAQSGGSAGGASSVGAASGTAFNKPTTVFGAYHLADMLPSAAPLNMCLAQAGNGSGGSGACCVQSGGGGSGGSGGSGSSGGPVVIFARNIVIGASGVIESVGGNGGTGGNGGNGWCGAPNNTSAGGGGGGAGGQGGSGGVIVLVYETLTNGGTIRVNGGTGGTGGSGGSGAACASGYTGANGNGGTDGANGVAGQIYYLQVKS